MPICTASGMTSSGRARFPITLANRSLFSVPNKYGYLFSMDLIIREGERKEGGEGEWTGSGGTVLLGAGQMDLHGHVS